MNAAANEPEPFYGVKPIYTSLDVYCDREDTTDTWLLACTLCKFDDVALVVLEATSHPDKLLLGAAGRAPYIIQTRNVVK